jgi:hypothetical protein
MGRNRANATRLALAAAVLAWLLGPRALRDAFPLWLVFLVALGLEVHFVVSGWRAGPPETPDRRPQEVDRDELGWEDVEDAAGEDEEEADEEEGEEDEAWEDEAWEDEWEEPRRLPLRRFAGIAALVAALAAAIWLVEDRTGWNGLDGEQRAAAQARFSEEASIVADKPVRIRCDESGEHVGAVQHADGVAIVGGEVAYLTPQRCHDLWLLAFRGEERGSRTARALAVLAHEAWHLRGVRDEGRTECYALQSAVGIGQRMGLSESTARRLMRQQLSENVLRGASAPAYLVPPECKAGGELDLDPDDPRFP